MPTPRPRRFRCSAALGSKIRSELESELQRQNACSLLACKGSDVGVGVAEASGRSGNTISGRSQGASRVAETAVDASELRVIQDVKRFQPELEFPSFHDSDTAGSGQVMIDEPGSVHNIHTRVPHGSDS